MTEGKGVCTLRHFRRTRGDEGAAAVEFALLFPIFMVLALGIMTAGTAFSRQINITQAAREASRYGATYDIGGIDALGTDAHPSGSLTQRTDAWLTAVDGAARQSAGNAANPISGFDYLCVAIIDNDGNAPDNTRHKENGGAPTAGGCPSVTPPSITASTIVQVVLSRDIQFFVLFINPKLHLDAVSLTPYEGTLT